MIEIRRGTTPTVNINIPEHISLDNIEVIFFTAKQNDRTVFEKEGSCIRINGQKVSIDLDQEDTLKFKYKPSAECQLTFKKTSGRRFETQIVKIKVLDTLKEGII